ncbi:site-specific integrase [Haloterrigena salifodinae]|uniref:Site-specific integrase n=1 Tax=Haloterrigena salifodinae TaxID=2675099 RepID=A0A8T8E5L4_9EURY|nr:site-specific integrase [Haloterrigena salifodinae]QRV16732.1 site-specific integrase [Haloterrigena salifodinae]
MRLEATRKQDQYKVWMTGNELEELRHAAANHRDDLIIQLCGYVGLRTFEIPQVKPKHVKRTDDGDHYRLRVPEGKDTTENSGKPRDVYLSKDVKATSTDIRTPKILAGTDP